MWRPTGRAVSPIELILQFGRVTAGDVDRESDVLQRRQSGDQVESLEDEPHPVASHLGELPVLEIAEVLITNKHLTRRQMVESGHAMHEGRLARAARL